MHVGRAFAARRGTQHLVFHPPTSMQCWRVHLHASAGGGGGWIIAHPGTYVHSSKVHVRHVRTAVDLCCTRACEQLCDCVASRQCWWLSGAAIKKLRVAFKMMQKIVETNQNVTPRNCTANSEDNSLSWPTRRRGQHHVLSGTDL